MSIRVKTALIIIAIAFIITAANFGSSYLLTQRTLVETMEKELSLALNIADGLVTTKIDLIEADAETVAARLKTTYGAELQKVMQEQ